MFLPDRLKEARLKRGMSQRKLAEESLLFSHQIADYERGVHVPNIDILCNIADALGVSIDWLCSRSPQYGKKGDVVWQTR